MIVGGSAQKKFKLRILLGVMFVFVTGMWFFPPIPQDPAYHLFVDQREFRGIPNFWNVMTNIPFLIFGLMGLVISARVTFPGKSGYLRPAFLLFFIGLTFVWAGSATYHLNPSNATLVLDRLAMTVAFMSFFSIIIGEGITNRLAARLLVPLLFLGVFSVFYWSYTEGLGRGDLRAYVLVQFLPVILIPMILVMFGSGSLERRYIWGILAAYVLSKLAEALDEPLYQVLGGLSGHSIKHLIASAAGLLLGLALLRRRPDSLNK